MLTVAFFAINSCAFGYHSHSGLKTPKGLWTISGKKLRLSRVWDGVMCQLHLHYLSFHQASFLLIRANDILGTNTVP